jgi:hypothetical protein
MTAEEGMRESRKLLGDVLGGYGRGWSNHLLYPSLTTLPTIAMKVVDF